MVTARFLAGFSPGSFKNLKKSEQKHICRLPQPGALVLNSLLSDSKSNWHGVQFDL